MTTDGMFTDPEERELFEESLYRRKYARDEERADREEWKDDEESEGEDERDKV